LEVVGTCCGRKGAVEYDVVTCVTTTGPRVGGWVGLVARAVRSVVGSLAEAVGVVGVKAVCDCEAEDGGADETVAVGDGCPYGWWGFVTVWWCAGDVGGVVGWGIVASEAFPHRLFGLHVRFGDVRGYHRGCDPFNLRPEPRPEPCTFTCAEFYVSEGVGRKVCVQ
jgi:hypothetical protein